MEEQSSHLMRVKEQRKNHGIHFTKKYEKARGLRLTYILTPHTVQTLPKKDEQWIQWGVKWEGEVCWEGKTKGAKWMGSHIHGLNIFAGESVKCFS